jgi:hypothetical protein
MEKSKAPAADDRPMGIQPGKIIVVDGVSYERFAVRMPRLVKFGENLESVLCEFLLPHFKKGDWVALSEKLISVSQNRVRHISTVKVSWLARFLVMGVKKHKNMTAWNSPAKMQVAIEEAGVFRMLLAAPIGAVGKLFGQRGWFWIVAGHRVSEIDGFIPEDMPPYTEYAVLPPPDPQHDVDEVERLTGMPAVVADANFIDVKILGVSKGVGLDWKTVRRVLLDNPLGQGNKMTPFVIVRKLP